MQREAAKLLYDILVAGESIHGFLQDADRRDFLRNPLLQSGVERQFEIIGEALNRLRKIAPELVEQIPNYSRIIAFRNVLAHGYDVIDPNIVWDAAANHLPELLGVVREFLNHN